MTQTSTINPAAMQRYFALLFPDAPEEAYIVISRLSEGKWLSRWLHPSQLPQVCGPLATQATHGDVYINLGLRHPDCTPTPETRGDNKDVYAIGGLWMDLDHRGGRHSAQNLPTQEEALAFIQGLPFRFSLLIDTSGGYHGYALFKELWILDTPTERDAAALLLRRFQRTIQAHATARGWRVDSTADLARVLRPAGTLNHKRGTPKPVTIAHEDPVRYNPSDIEGAPWLAMIEDIYTPQAGTGDFPPAQLGPIVHGCAWLQHCRDDAATLPEPEWYAMLGIVGRCEEGTQLAHEWSTPYPRYSKDETARKLTHALDHGPLTCPTIRYDLGGDAYCRACPHWEKITSPMVLGMAPRRRSGQALGEDSPSADLQDTRVVIRIGPDITRMVDEGQDALLALPHGPVLFQRARRLSVISRGVKPPRWLHRSADAPVIVEAPAAYLEELATKAARWEKYDKRARKGEEWVEVTPPTRFVKTLQGRPSWPFPLLEGIIHSPTLRPDGSILDQPGYDPDTGLFFDSNGTAFPAIPQRPTLDQARSAIGRLQEVVCNFPFAEQWHFSAWLSAVLSVVCRYAILGCVPMHGITATTPASGKSLLADTIALIGTGHPAARWSQVFDEDEERKRLLSLALDGDPLVCIDNIMAPLGSGTLAMALTARSIKDRLLGANQTKEAPLAAVFLCTGNNVQYLGDVARRVVPIALDPKMERPEERTDFLHPDLPAWVQRERPQLTIGVLTVVKAFFQAGCPAQKLTPMGSFEAWSDLIRHALVWAGEADPCEGRKDIQATSNPEFEKLAMLLHTWHACYDTKAATLKQAVQDIGLYAASGQGEPVNKWNDLRDALSAFDDRYE